MRLKSWSGRADFEYDGNVSTGTTIRFGSGLKFSAHVDRNSYSQLLNHFHGRTVKCGTSHDKPPAGSLGSWLILNVSRTALASYVSAILVFEGYAIKVGADIKFK